MRIPDRYEKMFEKLKDYEYYGGDTDSHLRFWNLRKQTCPELQPPPYANHCYCDHPIVRNCYVYNHVTQHFVVVGNCCIKRFQKRRLCRTCKTPHSGKKYDQCPACRKNDERRQVEERKRLAMEAEAERVRLYREEREKQKRADEERFNEIWRSGTVRDKLGTYQLVKLQRLAEQKGILKFQRYERDALIDVLVQFTTHRDLPIQ